MAGNQFDQPGNFFGISGEAIIDPLVGPTEVIDLSTVKPVQYDIIDAQLTVDGQMLTLAADVNIDFEFEVLGGTATMNLSGAIVLEGELPPAIIRGDVNCDGAVDLLDVGPFVELLSTGEYLDKADINDDGVVDLLDVGPVCQVAGWLVCVLSSRVNTRRTYERQ